MKLKHDNILFSMVLDGWQLFRILTDIWLPYQAQLEL